MKPTIRIFQTAEEMAREAAGEFSRAVHRKSGAEDIFSVALSGGSTPQNFFRVLAGPPCRDQIPWKKIRFFWADERCVPPGHPESNFGMARRDLLAVVDVPTENVFRIRGEAEPEAEAERYAREISEIVPVDESNIPSFDWIFLGVGEDGHTASLFPGSQTLRMENSALCGSPASGHRSDQNHHDPAPD